MKEPRISVARAKIIYLTISRESREAPCLFGRSMDHSEYRAKLSEEYSKRFPSMSIVVVFIFDGARKLLKQAKMKDNNFV